MDIGSLQNKVDTYRGIVENTKNYRKDWGEHLKAMIIKNLEEINKVSGLGAKVDIQDNMENLEVIMFSLGQEASGIAEKIENSEMTRPMIKHNGSLVYQQLFNGKVMIMIAYPLIEGYGQPKPPKMLEILRPEEFKEPYVIRHVEEFLKEIIEWEDYDDDAQKQMGAATPIGFTSPSIITEDPEG